jgi:O-antigen ligase|tara:strand:+ start:6205 stop:6573 length:369 start_codon:yes stop_codon:yes gene_type:complete
MKTKITPFVENIGEATAACLITMAQGNFLALGITHWVIASQTGLVAGVAASVALLLTQTRSRWVIAIVLGVATAIVDYFMHPGMIGLIFLEVIITGLGAAVLSFAVGALLKFHREKRAAIQV